MSEQRERVPGIGVNQFVNWCQPKTWGKTGLRPVGVGGQAECVRPERMLIGPTDTSAWWREHSGNSIR